MKTERNYEHREHGAIGGVTLETPDGDWKLNGKKLPDSSIAHLANFALQTLQDAYAGQKNLADCQAAFETKLRRLIEGTIGTRSGGGGADAFTLIARSIIRAAIKADLGKDSDAYKAFAALPDAEQLAKLDENIEANREALTPAVEAEIARRKAAKEAKAKVAKTVTFNI